MERIQYLVKRYLDGVLTPEELEEFNRLFWDAGDYRESDWDPLFKTIMDRADVLEADKPRSGVLRLHDGGSPAALAGRRSPVVRRCRGGVASGA
jgi:hypothetical protein